MLHHQCQPEFTVNDKKYRNRPIIACEDGRHFLIAPCLVIPENATRVEIHLFAVGDDGSEWYIATTAAANVYPTPNFPIPA